MWTRKLARNGRLYLSYRNDPERITVWLLYDKYSKQCFMAKYLHLAMEFQSSSTVLLIAVIFCTYTAEKGCSAKCHV